MTRLANLRTRLLKLRRRRRRVRRGTGLALLGVALLWLATVAFGIDWLVELNRPLRIVLLVIAAGVLIWVFRRFARPWFRVRETELDVALIVQQQHHIDSDLVAALQFESPEAPRWGSVELEQKVVEQTAQVGGRLDVMRGLSQRCLLRTAAVLAVTGLLIGLGAARFPGHATAFLNRMLLGTQHYPTRTTIDAVRINGHEIELNAWRRQVLKSPYGQPVRFEAACSGQPPGTITVELETDGGLETAVALRPSGKPAGCFAGQLPRLVDSVDCRLSVSHHHRLQLGPLYLGEILLDDAWTEPVRVEVVPLPTIEVRLEVTPPSYVAATRPHSSTSTGLRQISVIEGSRVGVQIISDKVLEEAVLSIDGEEYEMVRDRNSAVPKGRDGWGLEAGDNPLDVVLQPVHYALQVTDVDGLQLERPIRGVVRIQTDRRPQILASILTPYVLPEARPSVAYKVWDDYGLARLAIVPGVTHEDGSTEELEEIVLYDLSSDSELRKNRQDRYRLDLAPLGLTKGDQLQLVLEAVDFRGGTQPGKATLSETLVFQVTDEPGIRAAMSEIDRESARQFETMIEMQIDVGEGQ